jgi:pyridoxine 5-phosphate synthase
MAAIPEMVNIALDIKPDMITLVPEKREELTTEGGLNIVLLMGKLMKVVEKIKGGGIKVSLFIDPEENQIIAARKTGADMIEIHTGAYSDARSEKSKNEELKKIVYTAAKGKDLGFGVNAGHGLHYHNVREVASINDIGELSIGHSIIARALFVGLERAVRDMIALIEK